MNAGDVRVRIILNPDRTVGSVTTGVVSHTSSSLGRRRSLEVFGPFHLLVSLLTRDDIVGGTHISLERVPVYTGVTNLLESIDLTVSTCIK
jgi:hypothetical protein